MPTAFMPLVILRDMIVMFGLSVLSTLYPILKVNRFQPVEAIHHVYRLTSKIALTSLVRRRTRSVLVMMMIAVSLWGLFFYGRDL